MNSQQCPFCIRDFTDSIINETDLIVSFLPSMWLARGHALIIPKRHVEPPMVLTAEETVAIMQEAERLRSCLLNNFGKGVDIWQKSRPYLPEGHNGTKVDHLHVHVIPSEPGAEIYETGIVWTFDHFTPVTDEDIHEVVPLLRPNNRS